jgi:hypothetical protein
LLETQKELNEELSSNEQTKDEEIAKRKLEIEKELLEIKEKIRETGDYSEKKELK